jgi:hypothetical protein
MTCLPQAASRPRHPPSQNKVCARACVQFPRGGGFAHHHLHHHHHHQAFPPPQPISVPYIHTKLPFLTSPTPLNPNPGPSLTTRVLHPFPAGFVDGTSRFWCSGMRGMGLDCARAPAQWLAVATSASLFLFASFLFRFPPLPPPLFAHAILLRRTRARGWVRPEKASLLISFGFLFFFFCR